jgi:hypothetical protein
MPLITITFLTGSSALMLSDDDVLLLADLTADPQVLTDAALGELRARLGQEKRTRLAQQLQPAMKTLQEASFTDRQKILDDVQAIEDKGKVAEAGGKG